MADIAENTENAVSTTENQAAVNAAEDDITSEEEISETVNIADHKKVLKTVSRLRAERRDLYEKVNELSAFVDEYKELKKIEELRKSTAEKLTADGLEFRDAVAMEKFFAIAPKIGPEESDFILSNITRKTTAAQVSGIPREVTKFVEVPTTAEKGFDPNGSIAQNLQNILRG